MLGYYKSEKTTAEAIDSEGWLHTSDLGIIDSDNFIYIRGRCKNMLPGPSGQNIYLEEMEAKLNNYLMYLSVLLLNARASWWLSFFLILSGLRQKELTRTG